MAYLGLDIGTTGSKATIIDAKGTKLSHVYQSYKAVRTNAGFAEIDPVSVWQTVQHVIAQAALKTKEPVQAIAIASLGESFVALDDQDRVLRNSMLYADVRGSEEVADILRQVDKQRLFDITGMPINAMYTLNKLLWVQKHEPNIFSRIDKLFLFEDFIYYMLSGERCIDYSLASRTMFFDVTRYRWGNEVLSAFDLDETMLSKPVPTGSVIGSVRNELARDLNLPQGVLLVAGAHDQVCAALGAGVLRKGECVDGIGTSECITAVLDGLEQKAFMLQNHFCIEPYAIPGEYVTLAFSASGMSIMSWFSDEIACAATQESPAFAVLEQECPENPTDIFVLPHFSGSGTPFMDPFSSGALIGLRLSTTRSEFYKACMEGLCFEMKSNADLLAQMGTSINTITCVGGGSRSDVLLQIKADIMGIPVNRLKKEESGTAALAMLCATACGDYTDLKDAAAQIVKLDKTFEPNAANHDRYLQKFGIFQQIYPSLRQLNHSISVL